MTEAFDKDNIQADIWPGLLKHYQIFYFFNITDVSKFKPQLHTLAEDVITRASGAQSKRVEARTHKKEVIEGKKEGPQKLPIAGVNIAFSNKGMDKLGKTGLQDKSFHKGQYATMVDGPNGRDQEKLWLSEFKKSGVDGVLLICGTEKVQDRAEQLEKNHLGPANGVEKARVLEGADLNSLPGHEHFGFKDGIAQPQLEGLDTDENISKSFRPTHPGVIITGHGGGHEEPPWAKDGSYLAFRKLRQFVPEFKEFLKRESDRLHYTEGQLGARLVGRWESGAPVESFPDADKPDEEKKNDFRFKLNDQSKCPFAAHIRKARPRGDLKSTGLNDSKESVFDIMRRGIPYGKEVSEDEKEQKKTIEDRGLLFVCYQTNLDKGFEFITNSWINNNNFPPKVSPKPGADPIMADRVKNATTKEEKLHMSIVNGKKEIDEITFEPFVESHGGGYFFMPSLDLLRKMANE